MNVNAAGVTRDLHEQADWLASEGLSVRGHGFLNNHDPHDLSRLDKAIAVLAAAGYHETSFPDARRRILAFFRKHLVETPATGEPL